MSGYNGDAWMQRHSPDFDGPYAPIGDRHLCPDCGRILSRQWFRQIFGTEPEQYGRPVVRYMDPSDEAASNVEHRSIR